jgi:hypothetical protein
MQLQSQNSVLESDVRLGHKLNAVATGTRKNSQIEYAVISVREDNTCRQSLSYLGDPSQID